MKRIAFSLFLLILSATSFAQQIPDDDAFLKGTLPNGMTYYLCHNEKPAGCAEFYIAHNVGALQEEDNQNGLAHFLEHMAFNGTKHYPDKGLLDFLAKEGVRFGYNVNAYTSRTETVYNVSDVPLVRDSFVDSVLMILHDWSCDISCEQKALDEERGVISEEWRLGDDSRSRMAKKQSQLIYKGSKYEIRDVIGTLEVINGFKRHEILDFYHKWYRPDLQAIIVIGDFDTARMESRIKALFADIPAAVNPEPKGEYISPVLKAPLFEDMTDPEIKYQAFKAIYKQRLPISDTREEAYYKDFLSRQIVSVILADRFRERCKDKGCKVQNAMTVTSYNKPDLYTTLITAVPKDKNGLADCVSFVQREVDRMIRHGISADELEVAKLNVAARMHLDRETAREDTRNSELVQMALSNFLQGSPLIHPVAMKEVRKAALASVDAESIAPYPAMMFADCEKIYSNSYNNIEEPGIAPSKEEMQGIIASVDAEDIPAQYLEYPKLDLGINAESGTIVSVKPVKGYDLELWTLSNGAKLWYRKAEKVNSGDHISMTLLFDTGYKAFDKDKVTASRFALNYDRRNAGFRGCIRPDFKNYHELDGASVLLSGGSNSGRISVTARRDRIENAFKALYLQLTEPYFGTIQYLDRQKEISLKSLGKKKSPKDLYGQRCRVETFGDHPWMKDIDSAAVNATDIGLAEEAFRRTYGDFASMKISLCSDLPREQIEEYVSKYIASLKDSYTYPRGKYLPAKPVFKGDKTIEETNKALSAPFTDISCNYYFKGGRSPKERARIDILNHIMSARYLALIREERGGAYSVSFRTDISNEPVIPSMSYVDFQTRPEMKEILLKDVSDELERMAKDGPTSQEMELAVKYLVKHRAEEDKRVSKSLALQELQVLSLIRWGIPYGYDYESIVRAVKPGEIQAMARRLASGSKLIEVYTEE